MALQKKPYTVIDLFSGAGGASYGFKKNDKFSIRFAVDYQSGKPSSPPGSLECNATYEANVGVRVHTADLAFYDPNDLMQAAGVLPGTLDVLISCAPCTGFSRTLHGNHARDDPRNHLVERSGLFAQKLLPKILVMENARELLTGNFRHHAEQLTLRLEQLGYRVYADVHMLTRFGLPQIRERALIIAVRGVTKQASINDLWQGHYVDSTALTVRRAISRLPAVLAGEVCPEDSMHVSPGFSGLFTRRRLEAIPPDGGSWADLVAHRDAEYLLTPAMKKMIALEKWGSYPDVYGRLWWDKPAVTIKRECAHLGNGRYSHPEQHRLCTVREMALLNGFPFDYYFSGSLSNRYRHIGDAVPPIVSYQLSKLCEWMLSGVKPDISQCVLEKTSLRAEDIRSLADKSAKLPGEKKKKPKAGKLAKIPPLRDLG